MAASTTYTTDEDVIPLLPKNYDSASDLTASHFTALILSRSRFIDSQLATMYIPFNSTTDTIPTPVPIQTIAKYLVAAQALRHLAVGDRNALLRDTAKEYEELAWADLSSYVNKATVLPPEQKTGAVLTPGTGGSYDVDTYEAIIGVESLITSGEIPMLIPESVFITSPSGYTQYHLGEDFSVRFDEQLQKWVFTDHRNDFITQSSPTIKYEFTWERQARDRTPKGVKSGQFVMG